MPYLQGVEQSQQIHNGRHTNLGIEKLKNTSGNGMVYKLFVLFMNMAVSYLSVLKATCPALSKPYTVARMFTEQINGVENIYLTKSFHSKQLL